MPTPSRGAHARPLHAGTARSTRDPGGYRGASLRGAVTEHARRRAPDGATRRPGAAGRAPGQARRLLAATASGLVPGLGQLLNGRRRIAGVLLLGSLLAGVLVATLVAGTPPMQLAATIVDPRMLRFLMTASLVVLALRLLVTLHAFFDRRYGRPTPASLAGLALVLGVVAAPHALAQVYAGAADEAFARFFQGGLVAGGVTKEAPVPVAPPATERLNVLIVGIDSRAGHDAALTDTMMLASVDRTLGTTTLISIPRDLVDVPLGNGNRFGPKLNSLYGYARRHPDEFPDGPMRALQDAVGALLNTRVQYYAIMDFKGFVQLIDEAGGVDVHLTKTLDDPKYDGYGLPKHGLYMEPGDHHLNGNLALAYVRSRQGLNDSDFGRVHRQQEVLISLKRKLLDGGTLLTRLPSLLRTFGDNVRTDMPPSLLPSLAALADAKDGGTITNIVIEKTLVKGGTREGLGSVQVPRLARIRAMAAALLPPPGTPPSPWPAKKTSASPTITTTTPAPAAASPSP